MNELLKILQGLLTPIIAIIATHIAWQQWKLNRNKETFERYERRLKVYEEIIRFISIGIRNANYDNLELVTFRSKVSEADFLFGEDVIKYIDELYSRAVNLHRWNSEYRDYTQSKTEGYNHEEVVENKHEELIWITSQLEPARKLFKKYLDVNK